MLITFWKSSNPTVKHTLVLTRSNPGSYIRNLKAGGWKVRVQDSDIADEE